MKKILAFGASNSKNSINKKFARYAANQISDVEVNFVDLNDFELPLYGIDREKENGIPEQANQFAQLIESSDGIVVSLAEHNSNYTVAFKNLTDWISRLEGKVWKGKNMFLLSTSPGGRGGAGVMNIAMNTIPYSGGNITANFSLPKFYDAFSEEKGILDEDLKKSFQEQLAKFQDAL